MSSRHLLDNPTDRRIGEEWEHKFCALAAQHRKMFTPHQIGRLKSACAHKADHDHVCRQFLLPDITLWTAPGEHHEIKHKNPTGYRILLGQRKLARCYGLEKYRLDALIAFRLETQQPVMYTVHDWEAAGATSSQAEMPNDIAHWFTVDVLRLQTYVDENRILPAAMRTYVNGHAEERDGYYWPTTLWRPLEGWWNGFLFELPEDEQ